jgi:ATP-dependent exoDNAse (exonuclease V) beta subunit
MGYILAEKDEKEQNEAELKRLLYVAFTRAKDKLIISGHFTEKRLNGWISELLDPWKDELSEIRAQSQRQMKTRDGKPFLVRIATSSQQEIPIYENKIPMTYPVKMNKTPFHFIDAENFIYDICGI